MSICRICDREPARFRMLYDTMNGRADNPLCLGCVAGRLAAYPPNRPHVPRDFQPTEIIPMANNDITEEEMEELVASRDWPPYYMAFGACAGRGKHAGKHEKCPAMRQPTNHIDPHPTICTCECHDEDNPELKSIRERQQGFKEDPAEDEFLFDDDDDEFEFEDDDDPIIEDDEDEDEFVFDDEDEDEEEYVFD